MAAPSIAQSHVRYPLTSIFGSPGNVRVLRALMAHPSPQSVPGIANASGLSPQGVRLVIDSLLGLQLIAAIGSGRTMLYSLNDRHPFSSALVALFQAEQQHWESLFSSLAALLKKRASIRAAWLYGSVARAEDTPQSDLDIALLVSSYDVADEVRSDLMPFEDAAGIRISLTALTANELATLPEDDRWWSEVVRDAKVLKGLAPTAAKRQLTKAIA